MDLSTIRSLTRNLAFERSGDTGLVTDAELLELINLAARNIYTHVVNLWPAKFAERSPIVIYNATTADSVTFASLQGAGQPIHKITGVEVGNNSLSGRRPIPALARPEDRILYQEVGVTNPTYPARWWVEGTSLYFTRASSAQVNVLAHFIRQTADLVNDANVPWGGFLPEHHDKIAVMAAALLHMKDEKNGPFPDFFNSLDDILTAHLGQPSQRIGQK